MRWSSWEMFYLPVEAMLAVDLQYPSSATTNLLRTDQTRAVRLVLCNAQATTHVVIPNTRIMFRVSNRTAGACPSLPKDTT